MKVQVGAAIVTAFLAVFITVSGFTPVPHQAHCLIVESRRRFESCCLNNPNTTVSPIRLEPRPSCRFQVMIMLEMTNLV